MLYPHADNANHRLLYSCRNCDYSEVAEDAMVYYHKLDRELRCVLDGHWLGYACQKKDLGARTVTALPLMKVY